VKAFGGPSVATKRKLREIAAAAREGRFEASIVAPRMKPGTPLIRVWRGETHSVLVLEDGSRRRSAGLRSRAGAAPAQRSSRNFAPELEQTMNLSQTLL
jgi:hypothetical protein